MITILSAMVAVAFILLAADLIFRGLPDSAIAIARNSLFRQRDELFALGARGEVDFQHQGYQAARTMLNSFIRFAHDLTLSQLILTKLLMRIRNINPPQSGWDSAIASLPGEQREKVQVILDDAMVSMFRLMVTRSLVLSGLFAMIFVCRGFYVVTHKAAAKFRNRQKASESDAVFEEVISHSPGQSIKGAIKQQAKRYEPRLPSDLLPMAA